MADSDAAGPIFTDEDVRRVLAEERGDGEQGGWSLANQSDNVEVWRKAEEGVPVHLLKASPTVQDVGVCVRACVSRGNTDPSCCFSCSARVKAT